MKENHIIISEQNSVVLTQKVNQRIFKIVELSLPLL